ncbi:MAG: YeeE/YedE family protein [Rhizobiaceae bacterium]|nr:YeeE/YedE family protein [Rhizobiaceae bacterium]
MEELTPGTIAAMGGLVAGTGLGFAARWGNFCSLGAVEDAIFAGNYDRFRMWTLAIAVAIIGTFALDQFTSIDIGTAFYLATPTTLIATLAGGLIFGLGMSLVGTCGFGALARIGGGDLKSVVTFLVMGITAYATLSGAGAYLRIGLFPEATIPDQPAGLAHKAAEMFFGTPNMWAYAVAAIMIAAVLFSSKFRKKYKSIVAGALIGLMIVWGWFTTGILAADDFDPYRLESLTFSAPLGETLMYVMTMTGSTLKFGIGATVGVIFGAAVTTIVQGYFRWEACDDARELRRQMMGGMLMGFGGVLALGCTIGQGISAFSTLAYSAPIALIGIFSGAWLGLHFLVHGSITEAFQHLFASRGDNK